MMVTKRLRIRAPVVHMAGHQIEMVKRFRLLGVVLDDRLGFGPHVKETCRKAAEIYKRLERTARVTWGLNPEIVRTIYRAVIEPIMLYAASAWGSAVELRYVERLMRATQGRFAKKIIRAYRTVSHVASIAIAGLLPIDYRVREIIALREAKLGGSIAEFPGRCMEGRVSPAEMPHPAEWRPVSYTSMDRCAGAEVAELGASGTCIYTDGSKIEGKVGAALSVWRGGAEVRTKSFKLESFCTVFQAEMFALLKATELGWVLNEQTINILSDSRSSLDLLKQINTTNPVAFRIQRNIRDLAAVGVDVRLHWLRAHVGTIGNERADVLAKKAALGRRTAPDYDQISVSCAKGAIRRESVAKWSHEYAALTNSKHIANFLPDATSAHEYAKKTQQSALMTQTLTGHGGFGQYLHRFGLRETPWCTCGPGVVEDVAHVLLDCPRFCALRYRLECETDSDLSLSALPGLLANPDTRQAFIVFCKKVTKTVCRENGSTAKWDI